LSRIGGALYAQASNKPSVAAPSTQVPSAAAQSSESTVQKMATYNPQRPGMRPDGMGRVGSLMASTCRSNQSLTAWLVAHNSGPHSTTPVTIAGHRPCVEMPDDTTPQPKAHMGGNHVIGLSNSNTTGGVGNSAVNACDAGRDMDDLWPPRYSNCSLSAEASSPSP